MRRQALVGATMAWVVAVGSGQLLLWRYKTTGSVVADAPSEWPTDTALRWKPGTSHLVMFAHPGCPCTSASISELARLLSRVRNGLSVELVFSETNGATLESSAGWKSAARLHGATLTRDHAGREATRFHARTSGHVLLYDSNGRLAFSGGITPARGHEGASAGAARILALLRGEPGRKDSPVFGCSLVESTDRGD
jgi:hypothetical protein